MGIFSWLFRSRDKPKNSYHFSGWPFVFGKSAAGAKVNEFTAMQTTAVYACVRILEQKIAHGGHPVLRWNMDNIFIRTDPAGNIKADKAKSTEKIDGAIALIMALDRAIRCGNVNGESVYENRGLLVF